MYILIHLRFLQNYAYRSVVGMTSTPRSGAHAPGGICSAAITVHAPAWETLNAIKRPLSPAENTISLFSPILVKIASFKESHLRKSIKTGRPVRYLRKAVYRNRLHNGFQLFIIQNQSRSRSGTEEKCYAF